MQKFFNAMAEYLADFYNVKLNGCSYLFELVFMYYTPNWKAGEKWGKQQAEEDEPADCKAQRGAGGVPVGDATLDFTDQIRYRKSDFFSVGSFLLQ